MPIVGLTRCRPKAPEPPAILSIEQEVYDNNIPATHCTQEPVAGRIVKQGYIEVRVHGPSDPGSS